MKHEFSALPWNCVNSRMYQILFKMISNNFPPWAVNNEVHNAIRYDAKTDQRSVTH